MDPSASTYVVLGLLAKRPGSGYDLAALAERSLAHFWPISRSQLYSELPRLEELGWARGVPVAQDRYPDKRVYQPTAEGLDALRAWLDTEGHEGRRTKDGVLLKVFLGAFMSPDRLERMLDEYRDAAARRRAELAALADDLGGQEPTEARRFGLVALRHGILQAEATITWAEQARALMREPQVSSTEENA